MDPLTDDQLNEITARHAAATPGPWERYPEYGTDFYAYTRGEYLRGVGDLDFGAEDASAGDRAFVEHAVTDMGALLVEVRRLRARVAELAPIACTCDRFAGHHQPTCCTITG